MSFSWQIHYVDAFGVPIFTMGLGVVTPILISEGDHDALI